MSARVKIPADSEHAARLDTAAGRVKTSANNVRPSLNWSFHFIHWNLMKQDWTSHVFFSM